MSEPAEIVVSPSSVDENNVDEVAPAKVQTPKRTPSKRKSFVERAQAESEQLLKSMGINVEGGTPGRRTRSGGARSSPVVPVESPAKKAKATPKGKGRGKKLLDVVEKDEESAQDNSIESQKDEVPVEKEIHEEDKVDSVSTEVIPEAKEEEVQKEDAVEPAVVPEKESPETPVEAMEVDTAPTIILTPPEPEIPEVESADATAAPVEEAEEIKEDPVEDINAAQENELNTAEEIKQNETNSSDESKVTQNEELLSEDGTNNHVTTEPEEESVPTEQTETSGHCQTETEPPAANSDIVQTPQSCN